MGRLGLPYLLGHLGLFPILIIVSIIIVHVVILNSERIKRRLKWGFVGWDYGIVC